MRTVFCNASAGGRSIWPHSLALLVVAASLLGFGPVARSEDDARTKASTSRAARDDATRAIPFNKIDRAARAKATGVLQNLSLYRRLPIQAIDCEPELYAFLVRHPEVVVNIWHLMGITKMQLDRVDATHYKVADGEGTTGQMEYLYSSGDATLFYSEGTYEGPLYPRIIRGKCLMLLRTSLRRGANGRFSIIAQLDTFLSVENLGVEVLAKTFQPLVGRAADHNFTETANFVANLSQTAETHEEGLLRMGRKLNRIDAKTRAQFLELVAAVPQKLAQAESSYLSADALAERPTRESMMRD